MDSEGSCRMCRQDAAQVGAVVCAGCEAGLPSLVRHVVQRTEELRDLLAADTTQELDQRRYWHWFPRRRDPKSGELLPAEGEYRRAEVLTALGGAGVIPSRPYLARVAVSRPGSPAPVRLDALDLLVEPPRVDGCRPDPRRPEEGHTPVAVVLDRLAYGWAVAGAPGSDHLPPPRVVALGEWLVVRLPWACRTEAADVAGFAAVLRRLQCTLMGVLGEFDPAPEPCDGVECNRCDRRMLVRRQDGSGDVDCTNPACRKVFTAAQYQEWVTHLAAFEKSSRGAEEVASLLRRPAG